MPVWAIIMGLGVITLLLSYAVTFLRAKKVFEVSLDTNPLRGLLPTLLGVLLGWGLIGFGFIGFLIDLAS